MLLVFLSSGWNVKTSFLPSLLVLKSTPSKKLAGHVSTIIVGGNVDVVKFRTDLSLSWLYVVVSTEIINIINGLFD